MPVMNIIDAVNNALHLAFERDPMVVSFGEDAGFYGGVFRATKGLYQKFGEERSFDAPICEQGIAAVAMGMALYGLRPVAEMQFADYMYPAFDQMVNEIAKSRYRSGGMYPCPMVIRTPYGGGIKGGHYHSQSPEGFYSHAPGLKIVVPSDPFEAKGLLLASIEDENPVVFFEPKKIYRSSKAEVPSDYYTIPLSKAKVAKEGSDVTLIGWGAMHLVNMEAAALAHDLGISCEVIDLRTLVPFDVETLDISVKKTGRCVITHEAPKTAGFGAELSATLHERNILHLHAPIQRVTGWDTPFPFVFDDEYMPNGKRVLHSIKKVMEF